MLTRLNDEKQPDEILEAMTQTATSRRGLLAGGLTMALGASAGVASAQNRMAPNRQGSRPPGGLGSSFQRSGSNSGATTQSFARGWGDPKLKLLRKVCYGPTLSDVEAISSVAYSEFLENQLDFMNIDDTDCETQVQQQFPILYLSYEDLSSLAGSPWIAFTHAQAAMILRAGLSRRMLYQRMTEFWMDHFYVWAGGGVSFAAWADFARSAIWPNSMSTFKSILSATAKHGAMMVYLDNASSRFGQTNINYARELLELHTVGVEGGYVEADIYELAEILTGWGVTESTRGQSDFQKFEYHPNDKTPGSRTILGRTFNEEGMAQGEAVLSYLTNHPSTIIHITNKLSEWFLGRPASSRLIQKVGQVWGQDGDIPAVLRVILAEDEISKSSPSYKKPYHLVAGAFRQFGGTSINADTVNNYLKTAKHTAEIHVQPDGFADGFHYWSGGTVTRFFMLARLCRGWVGFNTAATRDLISPLSDAEKMSYINNQFFLGHLPVSDQIWIRRYLKRGNRPLEALSIALCSPSYQWF